MKSSPELLTLAAGDEETIVLATLRRPYSLPRSLASKDLHSVTLFVVAQDISTEEQEHLSEAIVALRPRWAIAAGHQCSTWDDSIDHALISQFAPTYEVPDDQTIMTTWHEDESVKDVLFFTLFNGLPEEDGPHRYAILIIGEPEPRLRQEIDSALRLHRPRLFSAG